MREFIAWMALLLVSGAMVQAQDAKYDQNAFDREVAKLKKLGKSALPVY